MDGSNENATIGLKRELIYSTNIAERCQKYKVPHDLDMMTIDLDLNTFWVLQVSSTWLEHLLGIHHELHASIFPHSCLSLDT